MTEPFDDDLSHFWIADAQIPAEQSLTPAPANNEITLRNASPAPAEVYGVNVADKAAMHEELGFADLAS